MIEIMISDFPQELKVTLDLRFLFRIHLVDIKTYIQGKPTSDIIINRLFLNGVVHKSMLGKANILKSDIIKVEIP